MSDAQAARALVTLARLEPAYETLAAEYGAACAGGGGPLPADFPARALDALCTVPEVSERAEKIGPNLPESYGPVEWLPLVTAVMVLLSVYGGVEYKNGKWSFRAGYRPLNAEAVKPLLPVLAAVIGKAGQGLVELSETLNGPGDGDT